MVERIVICGIPKSGTKLLHHMIHAGLPDWEYTPQERSYKKHFRRKQVITKKPRDLFFIEPAVNDPKTAVIFTCRDPLLVLTSKHRTGDYWVSAESVGAKQAKPVRWYEELLKWRDKGQLVVYYEDLVEDPNAIQEIIGERYGIQWRDLFSNFQNYPVPKEFKHLNIIRPIKPRRLKLEDLPYLGRQIEKAQDLVELRKQFGYGDTVVSQ